MLPLLATATSTPRCSVGLGQARRGHARDPGAARQRRRRPTARHRRPKRRPGRSSTTRRGSSSPAPSGLVSLLLSLISVSHPLFPRLLRSSRRLSFTRCHASSEPRPSSRHDPGTMPLRARRTGPLRLSPFRSPIPSRPTSRRSSLPRRCSKILSDSFRPFLFSIYLNADDVAVAARSWSSGELRAPASDPGAPVDHAPGPPFPDPESTARSTTTPASSPGDDRRRPRQTIDAIEARTRRRGRRLHPDSGDYPTTEETEAQGPRPDRPVGHRPRGLRRRDGRSSSTWTRSSSTARSSCTPLPASRRPTYRTASARRSSRTTCSRTSARPTSTRALAAALAKVDAAATPEHAARLQRGRQVNAVVGLVGAPIVFLGPVGLGVLQLAPLRQGPGLPRRSRRS